jgi:hypothetical protein
MTDSSIIRETMMQANISQILRLHGAVSQKIVIFILATVKT